MRSALAQFSAIAEELKRKPSHQMERRHGSEDHSGHSRKLFELQVQGLPEADRVPSANHKLHLIFSLGIILHSQEHRLTRGF
jgi:hypothetical protein